MARLSTGPLPFPATTRRWCLRGNRDVAVRTARDRITGGVHTNREDRNRCATGTEGSRRVKRDRPGERTEGQTSVVGNGRCRRRADEPPLVCATRSAVEV